jgi:hypothetical protein
MRGVGGANQN